MRTALFTDIHANLEALTACLVAAERERVDRYVCLGDTVGYGADPNAVCDVVRQRFHFAVLGNHDAAVAGRMDYSYYYAAAREVLDWTAIQLSAANMTWLRGLPYTRAEGDVSYGHGSPRDPSAFEYVFALEQAEDLVERAENLPKLTFIGHSHLQRAFKLAPQVEDVWSERVVLKGDGPYLISIGSCGQPRDYDPRACFGIWDDGARTIEFHRVPYDCERTSRKILEAGLSPHFARRLLHGV